MTLAIPELRYRLCTACLPGIATLCGGLSSGAALAASEQEPPATYELSASFDGEPWRNTSGNTGNRFLGHGMLTVLVNGAANTPGLSMYGSALFTNGEFINEDLVGAVQGISNIEAPRAVRLYETWLEWLYGSHSHSIKFGLYDLNSEFDSIETAGLFINPSHGIGPDFSQSGLNGPAVFPTTGLALRSWHRIGDWTLQFAVLDGVPGDPEHETRSTIKLRGADGLLLVAETDVMINNIRAAGGYWYYTREFDALLAVDTEGEPLKLDDNHGYYAFIDTPLLQQQGRQPGVNAYVRYGRANPDINPVKHYLGAGLVLTGLIPGRNDDQLGLAVGTASAGDVFRIVQSEEGIDTVRDERITELTYSASVNDWLSLQPDVQYVEHAGFANAGHTWVIGLRFTLSVGMSW